MRKLTRWFGLMLAAILGALRGVPRFDLSTCAQAHGPTDDEVAAQIRLVPAHFANSFSGSVSQTSSFTEVPALAGGVSPSVSFPLNFQRIYNSTDVTKCFRQTYSVTSTPTAVDLTNLTDSVTGAALSFASVVFLKIVNNDKTNNLTVGGVEANDIFGAAWPFTLVGQDRSSGNGGASGTGGNTGSCIELVTNIAISGTHKILELTASAGTISVDVEIMGN